MPYRRYAEALNRLAEAESVLGSPLTKCALDVFPEHRLDWLRSTREVLRENSIQPENLPGLWHTEEITDDRS